MNEVEPRNLGDFPRRVCEVCASLGLLSFPWSALALARAERLFRLRCSSTRGQVRQALSLLDGATASSVATSATPLPPKTRSSKSPTKLALDRKGLNRRAKDERLANVALLSSDNSFPHQARQKRGNGGMRHRSARGQQRTQLRLPFADLPATGRPLRPIPRRAKRGQPCFVIPCFEPSPHRPAEY